MLTQTEQRAYTVADFCAAFRISRTKLYDLWLSDNGPLYYKIGNRRLISTEAALLWQHALQRIAGDQPTSPQPSRKRSRNQKVECRSAPMRLRHRI